MDDTNPPHRVQVQSNGETAVARPGNAMREQREQHAW